ncbi:MAG: hypothetical protein EOM43_02075 [Gammaproteobacteria bacterium]|nr:hypothetical protein [Gammaproteobacteria bacterium]
MVFIPEKPEPIVGESENDFYPTPPSAAGPPIRSLYPVFGVPEMLLLGIFRPHFEPLGVHVQTQHSKDLHTPLLLVRTTRAGGANGIYPDDTRFLRSYKVVLSIITSGMDAEYQAAQLIEAAQHVILRAVQEQTVVPGHGNISFVREWIDPVRVSDFQTATNIVQYPSLPRDLVRYEQAFNIMVRPDIRKNVNPFVSTAYQTKE